jgi:maltose/maltodextrin transport system substrate-binding protein
LALMVSGPWDWANLRKAGVDFDLAPIPGVGGNPGRPFVGVFTALINRSSPNIDLAQHFLEEHALTSDGLKALDAEAPLGVPALKALCDEMTARNHLIKVTYENSENGVVMPNIPQMGRFWTSMGAAFEIATNGGATPEVALKDALKNMER